jgi:hypothetical protein
MNNFSACYLPAEDEKDRKLWKDKKGYKKLSEKTVKGQNTEKTRKALGKGVVNLLMILHDMIWIGVRCGGWRRGY